METKAPRIDSNSAPGISAGKELPPLLKEMQGSFALEGFQISDDRMLSYAAEFSELEKNGVIRERILRAMAQRSAPKT